MKSQSISIVISAFVSAVVTLGIFFGLGAPLTNDDKKPASSRPLYAQVRAAGTIRSAYFVGAPLFTIDPNTKQKSGIFYDIVTTAAARIGLNVNWTEEVGYGEMIQGLNAHRYDIIGSGVWINAARGKDADFTIPAYYDAVLPYVREDDTRFDKDISLLNSSEYTIATMDGELGAAIAKADYPKAHTAQLPQTADFTQLILNVVDRKADVVFLALAAARSYQAVNPGKIKPVNPNKPIRVFPVAIMVPQGAYELKDALDYALIEMLTAGDIDNILRKYEKVNGSFLRVAPPYQAPESIQ